MTVVVVGAGIIGTAVADALAFRGIAVTVLDMRAPGLGATQASAGVLAPFLEAHDDRAFLDLAVRSLDQYDGFISSVGQRAGLAIEYARTGTLQVALSDEDTQHLADHARMLGLRGVGAEWFEPTRLQVFEPTVSQAAQAALFTPTHGFVGVASLLRALLQAARIGGAIFEQGVEAARIDSTADGVAVTADGRTYVADWAVVAAGSWSGRVRVTGARVPVVRPIRGQLLHLAWPGDLPLRSVWGPACYTVPWSDGSLLVGATVEDVGFDERSTVAGVEALTSAVRQLLPQAGGAALSSVRVGLRPSTADGLPWVGPLQEAPRVVMATGHYRNGVLLAPLTADLVSRLIAEGDADPALAVTSPNRVSGR